MPVETKHVQRRKLHFSTLSDIVAEAERLAAAERDGKLKTLGNWTPGQVFNHVASWAGYPYEGFPDRLKTPPLPIRWILKLAKKKVLNKGMPQGVRIPKVEGGTVGTEPLSTEDALKKLRVAISRLESTPPRHASPAFGEMTHDDVKRLNMRHAELHFGFLQPQ